MRTPQLSTYRRHLPHGRIQGHPYFVSWRFAKGQPNLNPQERTLVAGAIRHFDGLRYHLLAYVIMDDHVHALVLPLADHSLQQILHSWKSFTAKELRKLRQKGGPVWQNESFDRIVRNETELIEKMEYSLGNPAKRWPEIDQYPWIGGSSGNF